MQLSTTAAVITGGASGLGEATARYFAENGAQVTILDRDAERGAQVATEIGGHFAQTDVTDENSVAAAIALAMEKMGKSLDEAAESVSDAAEEAAEEVKDAVDE